MDHTWYLTFVFCFDRNAVAAVSHSDHGILKIASRGTVDQRGQLCVDAVVGLADGAADPGKSRACIICDFIFGQDTAVDLIVETGQRLKIVKHVIQGIFFTVGNMEYLKHGGRIGKVASVAGSLLGIKPIITLKEGEICPSGIGRSRRKTVDKTIDLLLAYLAEEKADIADYSICIGYGYDKEEAVEFRDRLVSRLKEKGYDIDTIPIFQIGATIGVHTGPYPLGIGVVKKSIRE